MEHVVLYRKYRPNTFDGVLDQQEISTSLLNQIKENRVAHSYLFVGPKGTGKTTISRVFAKGVNCLSPVNGEPCNNCEICKSINESTTLDYIELDGATNNGVSDMRSLVENSKYAPTLLKYKVYVIDECHMLSNGAFNALLKTLEEPKNSTIFILATTEMAKIPATILSRCQKMYFKRITFDSLINNLDLICQKENRIAEPNALKLIASNSDGAMRDALSMLDQAFSMTDGVITENIISDMLGYSNNETIFALLDALLRRSYNSIISLLHEQIQLGKDVQAILNDLSARLRDCMILKATKGEVVLECTEDYQKNIESIITSISLSDILACISEINKISAAAKQSMNSLTIVETGITLMCLPQLENSTNMANVISRINSIESRLQEIITSGKVVTKEVTIERHVSIEPVNIEKAILEGTTPNVTTVLPKDPKEDTNDNNPPWEEVKNSELVNSTEVVLDQTAASNDNLIIFDPLSFMSSEDTVVIPQKSPLEQKIELLRKDDVIFDTILLTSKHSVDPSTNTLNIITAPPVAFVINKLYSKLEGLNIVVTSNT